jgi:hypothetical protein
MRALIETVLGFTVKHGPHIQQLRARTRALDRTRARWPLQWALDESRPGTFRLKGYTARWTPSRLGSYQRLSYDRSAPFEKDIPHFNRFNPSVEQAPPRAYLVPQAWREVVERLQWNQVQLERLTRPVRLPVEAYRVTRYRTRAQPFEGRHLHDALELAVERLEVEARAGDWLVPVDQPRARYLVETLEPQGADSFFRWGFFDSVLQRKEHFSDYVFEDLAEQLLEQEPGLRERFEAWKRENPALLSSQEAVLGFIYGACQRHREPEFMRVPVFRVLEAWPQDAVGR